MDMNCLTGYNNLEGLSIRLHLLLSLSPLPCPFEFSKTMALIYWQWLIAEEFCEKLFIRPH